jgi:HSP20 family protein
MDADGPPSRRPIRRPPVRRNPQLLEIAMNTIIRFDPLFDNPVLPDFFKGLGLARNLPLPVEMGGEFRCDIVETDTAFLLTADLPGVMKDNIDVSVKGDVVSISANVVKHVEGSSGRLVRSERYIGNLFRSFSLGMDIDPEKVVARYDNGVLYLTLPKLVAGNVKRIMVS